MVRSTDLFLEKINMPSAYTSNLTPIELRWVIEWLTIKQGRTRFLTIYLFENKFVYVYCITTRTICCVEMWIFTLSKDITRVNCCTIIIEPFFIVRTSWRLNAITETFCGIPKQFNWGRGIQVRAKLFPGLGEESYGTFFGG